MADDIELSADVSKAVSALQQLRAEGTKAIEAVGMSAKGTEKALNRLETIFAKTAASAVSGAQKNVSQVRAQTKAYEALYSSAEKAAQAQRATASIGIGVSKAGLAYNVDSGQFAGKAALESYQNQLAMIGRLEVATGAYNRTTAETVKQQYIQSGLETRIGQATNYLANQRERSARQLQLEQAFSSRFYKTANEGAGILQRTGTLLRQIPPATMFAGMSRAAKAVTGMSNSFRYAMYDVSMSAGIAGAAVASIGVMSIRAAVAHERAFAEVERTTQTSTQGYEVLRRQLELMSMEIPTSFEGLTKIATAAGQLGIGAEGVAAFTRTVAMLSSTTNLTADAAGIALARFRSFFSEAEDSSLAVTEATFSNLASSILKVGVNSIASETGIVNVGIQIASMADYAGYTANQVVGLAGALASIGVAPELSRGTITRTFSLIGNAVSKGGVDLEKFAALAGVSAAEFESAWGTDRFAGVFTNLVGGINKLQKSGTDANLALMDLGFASVRDRPLLLRLAEAADDAGTSGALLAQTMRDAEDGWRQNSELAFQYAKISTTTAARLQVLGQAFEQLGATMGEESGNFLGEVAKNLTILVRGFEEAANSDFGKVLGSVAVQATVLVGGLLLLISAGARTTASLQGIGVAFATLRSKGVASLTGLSAAFRVANLAMGLIGIVATLASVAAGFIIMNNAARDAKRGIQDMDGLLSAMRQDAESNQDTGNSIRFVADSASEANEKLYNAARTADDMSKALSGVNEEAEVGWGVLRKSGEAAQEAAYMYGSAAESFVKSQLLQSDSFRELFEGFNGDWFGQGNFDDLGIDRVAIDWDRVIQASFKGQDVRQVVLQEIADQLGAKGDEDIIDVSGRLGLSGGDLESIQNFGNLAGDVLGGLRERVLANIAVNKALQSASSSALNEIVTTGADATEIMAQLDEASQKTVDAMAKGMQKFVDYGTLIGLTQKMVDSDTSAEDFEKAWSDAYGGASFTLEEYLTNFRRGAEEQRQFITNLQTLGSTGLVDSAIISDLAAMGPEANRLVQAMVDDINATGGTGLQEFTNLWGQTGFDSMVAFATQAALGQGIIDQVLEKGGYEGLSKFNDALASGLGIDDALKELDLMLVDGKLKPYLERPDTPENLTPAQKASWSLNNYLRVRARVSIDPLPGRGGYTIDPGYATGGYVSGPGTGTSDSIPARLSNGEFVMTAAATRAIGVGNLYSMMRQAQGGRVAPSGGGHFRNGGLVSGRSNSVVHLSPEDRALLQRLETVVMIGDQDVSNASTRVNYRTKRAGV